MTTEKLQYCQKKCIDNINDLISYDELDQLKHMLMRFNRSFPEVSKAFTLRDKCNCPFCITLGNQTYCFNELLFEEYKKKTQERL